MKCPMCGKPLDKHKDIAGKYIYECFYYGCQHIFVLENGKLVHHYKRSDK